MTVQWFEKTSTRLAESLSFNFMPVTQSSHRWVISKTGHLVDPANVVKNGSQYIHGKTTLVHFTHFADSQHVILSVYFTQNLMFMAYAYLGILQHSSQFKSTI